MEKQAPVYYDTDESSKIVILVELFNDLFKVIQHVPIGKGYLSENERLNKAYLYSVSKGLLHLNVQAEEIVKKVCKLLVIPLQELLARQ